MRKFVMMIKPQFAELVESGMMLQTVLPTPKRIPVLGEIISLRTWTGRPNRSKQRVLRDAVVACVQFITITEKQIWFGICVSSNKNAFAKASGFGDWKAMREWFRENHGMPFEGIVIHWRNTPNESSVDCD